MNNGSINWAKEMLLHGKSIKNDYYSSVIFKMYSDEDVVVENMYTDEIEEVATLETFMTLSIGFGWSIYEA